MPWNRSQRRLSKLPTEVYRVYDARGVLLYVGASTDSLARMRDHKTYARWWPAASHGTVDTYPNRSDARYAEACAIRDEGPIHNVLRERSEEVKNMQKTTPTKTLSIFWQDGEVWIDAS